MASKRHKKRKFILDGTTLFVYDESDGSISDSTESVIYFLEEDIPALIAWLQSIKEGE